MTDNYPTPEVMERETMAMITEIPPLGYGAKNANISLAKKLETGEFREDVLAKAVELITSGECLILVDETDDGCFDGRPTSKVVVIGVDGKTETKNVEDNSGHERAKVAGGGYLTALAMYRALETPSTTIENDIVIIADGLSEQGIYCGAHEGDHAHDDTTDCGANDKDEIILGNGIVFRKQLAQTVEALVVTAGEEYSPNAFIQTIDGWAETVNHPEYFKGSTGASRLATIADSIKRAQERAGTTKPVSVIKHLAKDHNEAFIVPNYIEGKTFSQAEYCKKLRDAFPDVPVNELPQAFPPDIWRIRQLAGAVARISGKDSRGDTVEHSQEDINRREVVAFHAGVAYQVLTAATLTDGSLRNFLSTAA